MKSLGKEFKERKNELGLTTEQLSRLSGIPIGTINKILNGETKSPRYATLKALNDVLFRDIDSGIAGIREAAVAYTFSSDKKQGEYTLDDYYALPDDVRAELIDGHLIFLEAPRSVHQELISELLMDIGFYIRKNKGPCKVLPAPLDVQLDCDNRTMIQPDISVICQLDRLVEKGVYGAPDFCIEIVSPSSRSRDYIKKVSKYQNAGVREYWIVDPKRETVLCYYFEGDDYPHMYTFDDIIPVMIYDGKLEINFADIKDRLI